MAGVVLDPAVSGAVVGARVEVVGGPHAGTATTSDQEGYYLLRGLSGDVTLRASKEGYVPEQRTVSMTGDQNVNFLLRRQ